MSKSQQRSAPRSAIASHLIRFVGLNALLALLPLFVSMLTRYIGEMVTPPGIYAPELLFFAVAIGATALGDLFDEKHPNDIKWFFDLLKIGLVIGIITASIFYGFYQYDIIIGSSNEKIRNNIMPWSLGIAIAIFTVSLLSEILIALGKDTTP